MRSSRKPDLAAIPIMMYTSQEGEIYGGQARASGAVGVLPKSIRPIDVTKALYQLQLLPDRRDDEPSGTRVGRRAFRPRTCAAGCGWQPVPGRAPQRAELRAPQVHRLDPRHLDPSHRRGAAAARSPDRRGWRGTGFCSAAAAALALGARDVRLARGAPGRRRALLAGAGRDGAGGARIPGGQCLERDADEGDREMAHRR